LVSTRSFATELGAVLLEDGWRVVVYRGGDIGPPRLDEAKALVEEHYYRRHYRRIAEYLRREDALMVEEKKVHFVLEDERGALQGHQLLYGDGPSLVPCEVLQPEVDQRRGSRHAYEVKRAVLLAKGRYGQLLEGIAAHVLAEHGSPEAIPEDHRILGYSVEPAVMRYLERLGFAIQTVRGNESFLHYDTRELVARYAARALWRPLRPSVSARAKLHVDVDTPAA
jgi:hypothetical protein